MLKHLVFAAALGIAAVANIPGAAAQQRAVCYNCPPEWADWGSQLKAIQARLGIQVPPDN
jgi:putative spermidine/putrescine transport system substrate-binding protein